MKQHFPFPNKSTLFSNGAGGGCLLECVWGGLGHGSFLEFSDFFFLGFWGYVKLHEPRVYKG